MPYHLVIDYVSKEQLEAIEKIVPANRMDISKIVQKPIEITIKGPSGSGKTSIGYAIKNYLEKFGVTGINYIGQEELTPLAKRDLTSEMAINKIATSLDVTIREEQAPRGWTGK